MAVTHSTTVTAANDPGYEVSKNAWNDDHTIGAFLEGGGTGGLTDYDIEIGDTDGTPTYGMLRIGNATVGRTSFATGSLDLDGSFLLWNNGGPVSGNIEFAIAESSNAIRFAIPKSGAGNATYNPRSMLIAGPAPVDDDMVTVGYWQTNESIFDNLACDTGTSGADLGVQNDLEVEGDIFADSIKESTSGAGVTIADDIVVGTSGPTISSGSGDPEGSVTAGPGSIYLRTTGVIYAKASGSGDTGWVQVVTFGG